MLGHRGGGAHFGHAALQRGDVLARQGGAQLPRGLGVRAEILEDAAEEPGLPHIDLEVRQPEGAQPSTVMAIISASPSGLGSPSSSTPAW